MDVISTFTITPALPAKLQFLQTLAHNVWWAWNLDAADLFRRLDPDLWERANHNPVQVIGTIKQERLQEAANDEGFVAQLEAVQRRFEEYMRASSTWYTRTTNRMPDAKPLVAYFSAEYGLTEALPIYSGGLGVLSGDHLKAASDLGLPLVAVGLFYQEGYFRQYLNAEGWQQERYPLNDFYNMPVLLERKPDGSPLIIQVEFPNGPCYAQVWRVQVGRVSLFMLDANIPNNPPEYRDITDRLYGGETGSDIRMQQYILLGIGGIRALEALNMRPSICHMNEGHAAFMALERWRILRTQYNLDAATAREIASEGNVFTTHTNVPAAIDIYSPAMMDRYFANYYPQLGIGREEFLSLGRQNPFDQNESFSTPVLCIRMSSAVNGVSSLHGDVARVMWNRIWTGTPVQEVPIDSITNGIHTRSFISREMETLFNRYLGPRWIEDPADTQIWDRIQQIPDEELWQAHSLRRSRLVAFSRNRVRRQLEQRGAPQQEIAQASEVLHPDVLTIGFARRFATYKRATLLFRDLNRLERILNNRDMPVQIIYAGKAHPHDNLGKEFIRQIYQFARRDELRRRIVFLEDYDLNIARYLVQGVDIWLNTPYRPLEASGTSGMKAAVNGGLNFSTLDGWWVEGYEPAVGWTIGHGEVYEDKAYQDDVEARALYDTLENEIVPLFYKRGTDGLPREWIAKMKASISKLSPVYNTHRMVREYTEKFYLPVSQRVTSMLDNGASRGRAYAEWKARIYQTWPAVRVLRVVRNTGGELTVGQEMDIQATIDLAGLTPNDVRVELYHGAVGGDGKLVNPQSLQLNSTGNDGSVFIFEGTLRSQTSGLYGYALRVLPNHAEMSNPHELSVVVWAPASVAAA